RLCKQRGSDARLKWAGVLTGAPEGTPVHAIHGGRAVFGASLRGPGLKQNLDHGNCDRIMYGHNKTLILMPGNWDHPRDGISIVGNSGGMGEPALYFSIRHRGQPLDPAA